MQAMTPPITPIPHTALIACYDVDASALSINFPDLPAEPAACPAHEHGDPSCVDAYQWYQNFCVGAGDQDLPQTARGGGNGSLSECQAMCDADGTCSAVEWYEEPWRGNRCFHMLNQPVTHGSPTPQWRDAVCYVKA